MKQCLRCEHVYQYILYKCPACGYHPESSSGFPVYSPALSLANDGFDRQLFKILYEIEPLHFWFTSRNRLLVDCIKTYFPSTKRFCEIGCGTGSALAAISSANPQMSVSGSEIYLSALGYAAKRLPDADLFQADLCRFPFVAEFDVIGCFDVLEHIEDDVLALKNIHKALKENGGLLLTVPQHQWLWSAYDEISCHKRRYSRKELRLKIEGAGFKIVRMTSFMSFLLPLMAVSRFKKTSDPSAFFSLNRTLNAVFYQINRIEQILIRRNINLSFGGSLLCIAKK